jgi:RsiW-degrading membrane proteinase PrsW (M82 family)
MSTVRELPVIFKPPDENPDGKAAPSGVDSAVCIVEADDAGIDRQPAGAAVGWDARGAWRGIRFQRWFRLMLFGSLLWGFSIVAFALTHDRHVVPTVLVFGAFVVPVAWLVRVSERDRPGEVKPQLLAKAFVYGGALGFLSSVLLETPFSSVQPALFRMGVGAVEEGLKVLALVWIGRQLGRKSPSMGFVLGAAVGFGFEAFEDAGYALSTLASSHSWSAMANTELTRALTTPVTHGLWTAILGAVLFHQSRRGRFRVSLPVATTFAAVAGLHALWDLTPNLSLGLDKHLLGETLPHYVVVDAGLALLGLTGLFVAHRVRRRYGIGGGSPRFGRSLAAAAVRVGLIQGQFAKAEEGGSHQQTAVCCSTL